LPSDTVSLSIRNIGKTYPNGLRALQDVSLDVRPGEVFGLVGPNGAGKTTLLKIAAGLLFPQDGGIWFGDTELTSQPKIAARYIGLMPDPLGVYTDISAGDYLEFFGRTLGLSAPERSTRIERAIELLGLGPWIDSEVETLSAGWQRRLALGRVLIADTPLLLLDEPAAGLDVAARSELLGIVRKLAGRDRTIIISSHILPELQQLADRFGILNKGRWINVLNDQPFFTRNDLETGFQSGSWFMRCDNPALTAQILRSAGVESVVEGSDGLVVKTPDDKAAAAALQRVIAGGIAVYEYTRRHLELTSLVLDVLSGEAEKGNKP